MLTASILLFGCAQESAITGGPEDKEPPKMKKASPPDKTLRFTEDKIQITFNEFLQEGGFSQTIISPPMEENPKIVVNGKTLNIKLKGTLRANTTYTINFGDDIKDLNQANIAPNFTYVFSTGDYIDSQKISGQVMLAKDGKPVEGIIVALYPKDSIDALLYMKPLYFSKTDKSGNCRINNIKSERYQVFALKDQNFNYIYDQPNELIAFSDTIVSLTDTTPAKSNLLAFEQVGKKVSIESVKTLEAGKLEFAFNGRVRDFQFSSDSLSDSILIAKNATEDTIIVWYSNYYQRNARIYTVVNDSTADTTRIELKFLVKDSVENLPKYRLSITNQSLVADTGRKNTTNFNIQRLYGTLKINLSRPVIEISPDKSPEIIQDSTETPITATIKVEERTRQTLELDFARKENTHYTLTIPDSMYKDIFGMWNKKIVWRFSTDSKDAYGNIKMTVKAEHPEKNYVIKLLNSNNNTIYRTSVAAESEKKISIDNVPAGAYHLEVIEDDNNNGRWDTGNLKEKKQPEKVINIKDTYTLKGGWDLDVEVKL